MNNEFKEKRTVFITGVSSGFGYALTKLFLEDNFNVFGISRRYPNDFLNCPNFKFLSLDLSKLELISKSLSTFLSNILGIDLIILNAGYFKKFSMIKDVGMDELNEVMTINTWSNKLILDFLLKNKKINQVIASSSSAGVSENDKNKIGHNTFALSKCMLNYLIKMYALENINIHFVSLSPGFIDTPMSRFIISCGGEEFPDIERYKSLFEKNYFTSALEVAKKIKNNLFILKNIESGSFVRVDEENHLLVSKVNLFKTDFILNTL